jgi:hypothetical protein
MKVELTQRGFGIIKFKDTNDVECSLQDSSSAEEPKIWLGVKDANPKILVYGEGWKPLVFPEDTMFTTRMHLNREQVKALLPYLQKFVETGDYLFQMDVKND